MKMNLSEIEVRILGCLIEKEMTTPDTYPLSLNALIGACNQKSNRAPLLTLEEAEVVNGLDRLGDRGLARHTITGGRVPKYRHSLSDKGLSRAELAVLAELLLRGPQTAGELRTRADRMVTLADMTEIEEVLKNLMNFGPPLVVRLPRRHGQKDQRYAQLFSGEPQLPLNEVIPPAEPVRPRTKPGNERLGKIDENLSSLREEIAALRTAIIELTSRFA